MGHRWGRSANYCVISIPTPPRHGFAVNTILDGYRDGREPGNRIALLSTYLGHVDPVSTYWYLSAAPELLTLVGDRLERHLGGAA